MADFFKEKPVDSLKGSSVPQSEADQVKVSKKVKHDFASLDFESLKQEAELSSLLS